MKTLYGNAGSGPASKSIQRKTSQIPPYGYIAAIGLVASAEQAYAVVVDTDNITNASITPDVSETLIDLSNLDVTSFIPDVDNPYTAIVELGSGSNGTATIWNSATSQLVYGITVASSFTDITGTSGADSLKGNNQFDEINGGAGSDTLYGGSGDDRISGGADNDVISGGHGNDVLNGSDGDDTLFGGTGRDTLSGGNSAYTFVFLAGGSAENGINLITDFTVGTDKIRIQWEGNGLPTNLAGLGLTLSGSSRVQLRDSVTNELIANFSGVSQSALQNQIDSDFSSVFEIV